MKMVLLLLPLLLGSTASAQTTTAKATSTPSKSTGTVSVEKTAPPKDGRLPADVAPTKQSIRLVLDPAKEQYTGSVEIDANVATPRTILWLHARKLNVSKATVNDQPAVFKIVDDVEGLASLTVVRPIGGHVVITLEFSAAFHNDLDSLYRVKAGDDWYAFTQFEPLAAREAFPCFDEPRFKIPFETTIVHPSTIKAFANTKVLRETNKDGVTTTAFATTKPLPTYLLALTVGPLDVVDGRTLAPAYDRKDPLPVRALTVKGKGALVKMTLENSAKVIEDQEKAFGIGYPYDKLDVVAVPDFAAGAMENAGLITYRDTLLFVDDKSPIGVQQGSLNVIAHESAHQWFGDLVTMAWWDDLWLNEAFATWFAARTVHRLRPDFDGHMDLRQSANNVMGQDSLVSARQIREPIHNRGDIQNAFDGITYSKGAAVITMFEEYIDRQKGAGTFLKGVSAYLQAHRHANGTTADFLSAVSTAAGFDITPAFSTFLDQPGVPLVKAACEVKDGKPQVTLQTERFLPVGSTGDKNKQWDIPVCVSFLDKKPQVVCSLVKGGTGAIALPGKACPKAVHPNADGAGYYRFSLPAPQLKALAATTKAMTAGERLSFSSALRAGFAAATMPFGETLAASEALAGDVEAGIATTSLGMTWFARELVLADDAARKKANVRVQKTYQPHLNKLGFVDRKGDTPRDRERRQALFAAVVDAEGPPLATAVAAGKELFTTSTTKKLANDLWVSALRATVEHGKIDAATWDAWLVAAKKQADPRLRGWMIGALASTVDPALTSKSLNLLFDAELRKNEITMGLWNQVGDRRTIDGAFLFVTTRYDEIAKQLPEDWRPGLASAFSGYCDEDKAKSVDAFFAPKVKSTPGLDRALKQALESIRLCAAKKAAHQADILKTFK